MIGDRIYLRTLELSDISTTQEWINDPKISDIMGYLPTKSLLQQEKWFETTVNDNSRFIFAVCLRENNSHIGNVALGRVDYISRHGMLSIFISNTSDRGKGYGSEAVSLLLDFSFLRLNLHKVYLQTSPEYLDAIKMYNRIGFVKEGELRDHYYSNGTYKSKIIYSLLKSEYFKLLKR